jgi:CheY-like chemotaxis protein
MRARDLTSDIVKLFNRAFGAFKNAQPGEGEPTQTADVTTESSIASPDALVIDDRLLPEFGSRHFRHLYDPHDSPQGTVDRWCSEVLLKKLEYLGSDEMQSPARFLFLINLCFRSSPDGKLSSRDGLKVLEHIRFTESLPDCIRFAPAVLYSFEAPWKLLTQIQHPLLVQGAGLAFARLPEDLGSLSTPAGLIRWKTETGQLSAASMHRMLHPSKTLGGGDLYAHSYRNIAGATKFCREFAGDVLGEEHEIFARFRQKLREDLNLKRLMAIQPNLQPGEPPAPETRAAFVKDCKNINFLLFDDEHAEGWSIGLYAGITGTLPAPYDYSRICAAGEEIAVTSDGRMGVKARERDLTYADELALGFQKALVEWRDGFQMQVDAHENFQNAAVAHIDAKKLLRKIENDLLEARPISELYIEPNAASPDLWLQRLHGFGWIKNSPDLQNAEKAVTEASIALAKANKALNSMTKLFKESNSALQYNKTDQGSENRRKAIENLGKDCDSSREIVKQKEQEWTAAKEQCGEVLLKLIDALDQSLADARNLESKAKQLSDDTNVKYGLAKTVCEGKDKSLHNFFPFNLIFLDLRINPRRDSTSTVREATGMKVLASIQNHSLKLPVIMMTASDRSESLREAYLKGAEYWVKGTNTGDEMREMVRRASERAALLPLWIDIQQVRERNYVSGRVYDDKKGSFGSRRISIALRQDREKIDHQLKEAFQTIWEYSGVSFLSASEASLYFNPVIANLAIIQEIRLANMGGPGPEGQKLKKRAWDTLGELANNGEGVYQKERQLHQLRNAALHSSAQAITRLEAEDLLRHTLAELLRDSSDS